MTWKRYDGGFNGLVVEGDPCAPRVRWWNRWWVRSRLEVVVVLEVTARRPYRVGYYEDGGQAMISTRLFRPGLQRGLGGEQLGTRFRVLVGREERIYFAIDADDQEVPLVLVERTTIVDEFHAIDGPLL